MMVEELTGILYILGLTLLRFGVPLVLTWVLGWLLQRAASSTKPKEV